ncbi:MAG TPA: substrate-binding domain-containing protein [Tepidisphaeraceae bacterium]|nr:substrate-binding domain-containing protein [Tepidisphaeraceae bacterium]
MKNAALLLCCLALSLSFSFSCKKEQAATVSSPVGKQVVIGMVPKSKGDEYFIACRKGADEAAEQLGVKLIWDGPTEPEAARQNEVVDDWITRGVDVIAVSVENKAGISTVLRKAREKGIKVITWDADSESDARDYFINQATPEGIGQSLMDNAAGVMQNKGEFALIMASRTAGNMIAWSAAVKARLTEKYPDIKLVAEEACEDRPILAFNQASAIIKANPNVKLIMTICAPGMPPTAEAVKQSGRTDVKVIGLGTPKANATYVHEGVTQAVILWNSVDLGYLTVHAAKALAEGRLKVGETSIDAGRLGKIEIKGDNVLLGSPFRFDKTNIDQFNF